MKSSASVGIKVYIGETKRRLESKMRAGSATKRIAEHTWAKTTVSTAWSIARILDQALRPQSPIITSQRSTIHPQDSCQRQMSLISSHSKRTFIFSSASMTEKHVTLYPYPFLVLFINRQERVCPYTIS